MVKFFTLLVFWQGHFSLFLVKVFLWIRLFLVVCILSEIMNRDVFFISLGWLRSRMFFFHLRSISLIVVFLPVWRVFLIIIFLLRIVWILLTSWSPRLNISHVFWRLVRILLFSLESVLLRKRGLLNLFVLLSWMSVNDRFLLRQFFVVNWLRWQRRSIIHRSRWGACCTYWISMEQNLMINVFVYFLFKSRNFFFRLILSHRRSKWGILLLTTWKFFAIKSLDFHFSVLFFMFATFIIRFNNVNNIVESVRQFESARLCINMGWIHHDLHISHFFKNFYNVHFIIKSTNRFIIYLISFKVIEATVATAITCFGRTANYCS